MKFGPVPVAQAAGAILAHSVQVGASRLRKGLILDAAHLAALTATGIETVTVAQLARDDIHEDAAAAKLAAALVPGGAHLRIGPASTGRCNIFATHPGVAVLDAPAIDVLNAVHPMVTVATVPRHQRMAAGGMIATVKIIAYGVPQAALEQACAAGRNAVSFATATRKKVHLIETQLEHPMSAKGAQAMAARVQALGGALTTAPPVAHSAEALAQALGGAQADLLLILTASATSDLHDTAPEAVRQAGGEIYHFGMPVDPGNLLFIGQIGGTPVIGLPGCARAPALNGADWVLERLMCGITVTPRDIMGMGVGGLLKEIPTRPQPRAPVSP